MRKRWRWLFGSILLLAALFFGIWVYLARHKPDPNRSILWGVTFSDKFAENLGLDPRATYSALLTDLGVRHFRLVAYWDLIESEKDKFDFTYLDNEIKLAEEYHADVILAMGAKAPRWPECYYPTWTNNLTEDERRAALNNYLKSVAVRYKNSSAIKYWQVENEPYLPFGNCAVSDEPVNLKNEIAAVKSVDATHPVLVTGSIFVDPWYPAARAGDVFGTSMYRRIYTTRFGYTNYPFSPAFYRTKESVVRALLPNRNEKFIVIELQAEPWVKDGLPGTPLEEQLQHFDVNYFKDMIGYAKESDFDEYYLWGAEWWYWMKEKQNHPEFWNYAKDLFTGEGPSQSSG